MKSFPRYLKLVWRLAKVRFSDCVNKDAEYRRTIFYALKSWGGVYIKFLQVMAGTSKFMEGWGGPREMEVFAQAPREPIDLDKYINLANFQEVSATPVAAGSFALVYKGKLKTGDEVAIKILRPSIQHHLKHDLAVLKRLCGFFAHFLPETLVNYNEAYAACAKMFLAETNYYREMSNQEYFAKLYQGHPLVVIPKVYRELSSATVIVQEFITGPTLADVMSQATSIKPATILARELTGSDLWEQVVTVGGEALYMSMCAGYVYGDPHPGNIILLPENRIAFIDFGIIACKPLSHRAFYDWVKSYDAILAGEDGFRRLLETTVTCFCPDISLAMQRCMCEDSDLLTIIADAATAKLNHELRSHESYIQTFRDGHLIDIFKKTIGTKTFNIRINMVNFELLKAIQAFLGSVTILDNTEGRHSFANIMSRSMAYALTNAECTGIPHDDIQTTRLSLTESYELIVNTMSAIASSDEFMFNLVRERIFS